MSQKQRKSSRRPERSALPVSRRLRTVGILLLIAVAGAAGIVWWPHRGVSPETQPASVRLPAEAAADPEPGRPATTTEPANDTAAAVAKPDLRKLKGRWRRTGEQYVLEVRNVDESGQVDAAYFNPQPIHVGRAMAKQQDGAAALFVELQDTGYPGCTYTLIHAPQNDQLEGIYYQAAQQERYEVTFERMN